MSTYRPQPGQKQVPNPAAAMGAPAEEKAGPNPGDIQVHGFQQVLEMLKIADPEFRESLLRRLSARDMELAIALRSEMRKLGIR